MTRSQSSRAWLAEHVTDEYVRRARKEGYRSRAVYKLKELDERDHLFAPGRVVVDLGAAPGGWSQYAAGRVGARGRVIALDILPMDPLPGVTFLQGDFTEEAVLGQLLSVLGGCPVDLVLSDLAPNMSGISAVDQPRVALLAELALDFARRALRPGGGLLVKTFQGQGFSGLLRDLRGSFSRVASRKPKASRPRSPEVYLWASGYRGGAIAEEGGS